MSPARTASNQSVRQMIEEVSFGVHSSLEKHFSQRQKNKQSLLGFLTKLIGCNGSLDFETIEEIPAHLGKVLK